MSVLTEDPAAQRGRTRITSSALEAVALQVTADAFGITRKHISVDLEDAGGNLSVRVSTPLRIPSLREISESPKLVAASGGTIVDKTVAAQQQIRSTLAAITGSTVSRVIVEITGANIQRHRRVK